MRKIERIPEYSVEVRFKDNLIQVYDLILNKVVANKTLIFTSDVKEIKKNDTYFEFLDKKDEIIKLVCIDSDYEKCSLATNAQYIFNIHMDNPDHGFYVGTYQIGEFTLMGDNKLVKNRTYPLHYCVTGCVTPSKQFYLCLRKNENKVTEILSKFIRIGSENTFVQISSALEELWETGNYFNIRAEIDDKNGNLHLELIEAPDNVTLILQGKNQNGTINKEYII